MPETAVQTSETKPVAPAARTTREPRQLDARSVIKAVLTPLASLRLTVVLFAMSLLLVFAGTLAQRDAGIQTVLLTYFRSLFVWIPLKNLVFFDIRGGLPYPGGWLLGGLLFTNLIAAHAVRFQISWKRAGILIIHSGLVVMFLSEFITGMWAVEGNMTIEEGKSSNYVEHTQANELAIIDASQPETDDVVVVPDRFLRRGGTVRHELLPFDVEVIRYMFNSALVDPKDAGSNSNPATAGDGLQVVAVPKPEVSGTDTEQKVDVASAYLRFKKKGTDQSLGSYLVSLWTSHRPQHVTVDGKAYDVSLRLQRTYKPYTISLIDFRHDIYLGTDKPKDFSSFVRLVDPTHNEDREERIWMNHPLRHAGETFYQSSFLRGDTGTVLQVVKNPGWLLPYISCAMVAAGMLIHFGISLPVFLVRQAGRPAAVVVPGNGQPAPRTDAAKKRATRQAAAVLEPAPSWPLAWMIPLATVIVAALYLLGPTRPPKNESASETGFDLDAFGRVPVVHQGRLEPLDTLARNSLLIISNRQTYRDDNEREQPAIRWLLDVMTHQLGNDAAEQYKIFRIENHEVLGVLGLEQRSGLRYAIAEFRDKMGVLQEQATRAQDVHEDERTLYQHKIIELARHLQLFINLSQLEVPHMLPPRSEQEEWRPWAEADAAARQAALARLRAEAAASGIDLAKLPKDELLAKFHDTMDRARAASSPDAQAIWEMLLAYVQGEKASFNRAVADYRAGLPPSVSRDLNRLDFEVFFSRFAPFYHCALLYVAVFALACAGFLVTAFAPRRWSAALNQVTFWLIVPTFLVHTFALLARMYLMNRWFVFVTNLYSSAIFIGWGCVLLGLILELIYRNGIGSALAGVTGFLTLLVAHGLALAADGDTLEMMQAVLDTNFWLATHVTCVTFGYAATFVAGFIAILFLLVACICWLAGHTLDREVTKVFGLMIYGVVCFAMLLSFTGTVLGGIWADQSWGRFWGWDPKENGALMIVIWNALILHARWGGLVRERGLAMLAIAGDIVTSWSWFGTNQLGKGLHAYGFNKSLSFWLLVFVASQLVLLAVGAVWLWSERRRNERMISELAPAT